MDHDHAAVTSGFDSNGSDGGGLQIEKPKSEIALSPDEPPLRVMALHAMLYCERLFYLEEVEEIRVADAAVYAGRRLHDDVTPLDDESPERRRVDVASEKWGLLGIVDAVRRRDGAWVAYEHKRGRCRRGDDNSVLAWPSDRIQAIAYALLLEETLNEPVVQARVRYHADNVTAFVAIDDAAREELLRTIVRARELRRTTERPPVHSNENVCKRCSLAVVCLPEEERLARPQSGARETDQRAADVSPRAPSASLDVAVRDALPPSDPKTPTLFPSNRERQTLHVMSHKAIVSRSGDRLVVNSEDETQKVPIQEIDAVVVHGYGQVTTQAIHLCAYHGVAVQWMTAGGRFGAGTTASAGRVQQRIRQYQALVRPELRLELTRRLVHAKVETQLRYLLRATRGNDAARLVCRDDIERMREALRKVPEAGSPDSLRGLEGIAAKSYFASFHQMLGSNVPEDMRPQGRTKHPPRDRFNCLLSFGYALVQSLVHRSLVAVGLEPAFGFFHQPRTAAPPLVLDVMELFRTSLWEMPVVGSVNRGQWDAAEDFEIRPGQVWLSESGRKKALELFEQRLQESYKHPYTGQSLCYSRMVELEVRLLEKEWTGCPGLFARLRLR
ncbi:MAG TPA: type I-MYXAN CRISPR-associated endonuclease Cas1 [Planctomycetaceae bacterium]|jgi:CRISPR-associated protein Cas1